MYNIKQIFFRIKSKHVDLAQTNMENAYEDNQTLEKEMTQQVESNGQTMDTVAIEEEVKEIQNETPEIKKPRRSRSKRIKTHVKSIFKKDRNKSVTSSSSEESKTVTPSTSISEINDEGEYTTPQTSPEKKSTPRKKRFSFTLVLADPSGKRKQRDASGSDNDAVSPSDDIAYGDVTIPKNIEESTAVIITQNETNSVQITQDTINDKDEHTNIKNQVENPKMDSIDVPNKTVNASQSESFPKKIYHRFVKVALCRYY